MQSGRALLSVFLIMFASSAGSPLARAEDLDAKYVHVTKTNSGYNVAYIAGLQKSLDQMSTDDAFASVGRGYNPITGEILPKVCVDGTEPDHKLEPGTWTYVYFNTVKNMRQNSSASGSAVGFSAVIDGVSLGFGHSDSEADYFNSVDGFGRVLARVATRGLERRNIKWAAGIEQLLLNNPKAFIDQCGTRFIRSVFAGHLLDQWVRFSLKQDQTAASSANSMSVGVADVFSVSGSTSEAQTKVNQYADTSFSYHGRGALSLPPAPTAGQSPLQVLIDYYNGSFMAAVTKAPLAAAVPVSVTLGNYADGAYALPSHGKIPSWTDNLAAAVLATVDDYQDLINAISDIDYAVEAGPVDRIKQFYNVTPPTGTDPVTFVKILRKNATDILGAYTAAVEDCKKLATGPETLPHNKSAVSTCQIELSGAINPSKVAAVTLQRKFN